MVRVVEGPINWAKVGERNGDLSERLASEGLDVTYDEDGDTLLITIGEASHALTEEVLDDVLLRIHPDSLKIQGAVILAFEGDFLAQNKLIRRALQGFLGKIRASGGTISLRGEEAKRAKPYFDLALYHG